MSKDSLRLEHLQQTKPNHCVPACVRMVLHFWGCQLTEADIAARLGTSATGTPTNNLFRLEALNLSVRLGQGTIFDLKQSVEAGAPPLVFVETGGLPHWEVACFHALVVVGVESEGVAVHDPYLEDGPTLVPLMDFMRAWAGYDWEVAVIIPRR